MPSGTTEGADPRPNRRSFSRESVDPGTALALLLLAAVPYLNTLANDLVYDDRLQINGNPYVHSFRYLRNIFGTTVWTFQGAQGVSNYYRPLMTFAYLLCYKLYGTIPFGYHLLNLSLNAVVVLLLFVLTWRLFRDQLLALVAVGLFSLHPMHTENVAWVASLPDLELAVFFLLTLIFYLRLGPVAPEEDSVRSRIALWKLQIPMLLSYFLALLSKEQALMLPLIAAIYEHFYRPDRQSTLLRDKIDRYALLWIAAAAYACFRTFALGGFAPAVARPTLPWSTVLLTAVSLTGAYLGKLIWPVHFSVFYVFHEVARASDPHFLAGLGALLLCLICFLWLWRHDHAISFAFLLMGATLGPVLNARWMPAAVFAERYLYLPSIGFCWLAAWAATKVWRAASSTELRVPSTAHRLLRASVPATLTILATLYATITVRRNLVWRSEASLYAQTLSVQPDAQLIRTNVGVLRWDMGDMTGAEREWTLALAGPHSPYAPTLADMGLLRMHQKRYDEALDYFHRALSVSPKFMDPHRNLATIYAETGRADQAEKEFRIAVSLDPMSSAARNAYGQFLLDHGRTDEAKQQFAESATADDNSEAETNLGDIYLAANDTAAARKAYLAALKLSPFETKAHFGLGAVNERGGHAAEAMREYHAGLDTDPTNAEAQQAVHRLAAQLDSH